MQIKEKHLQVSKTKAALKRRREREEKQRELRAKRITKPSEFTQHVKLLDSVHEAYRGAYSVRVRGHALCRRADIRTEHLVAPRS